MGRKTDKNNYRHSERQTKRITGGQEDGKKNYRQTERQTKRIKGKQKDRQRELQVGKKIDIVNYR